MAVFKHFLSQPCCSNLSITQSSFPQLNPAALPANLLEQPLLPNGTWKSKLFEPINPSLGRSLIFLEPNVEGDKRIASCRREEIEQIAKEWEGKLLGSLLGKKRPHLPSLKRAMVLKWRLKSSLDLSFHGDNAILLKFGSDGEKTTVLEAGPWFFNGRLLVLKPWRRHLKMSDLDTSSIPIWVKLPNLPVEFWSKDSLSRIGSLLGRPLFCDEMTASRARSSFARICIEISASEDFATEVLIDIEGSEVFSQAVKAEWKPARCSTCKVFFHDVSSCPRLKLRSTILQSGPHKISVSGSDNVIKEKEAWKVVQNRKNTKNQSNQPGLSSVNTSQPKGGSISVIGEVLEQSEPHVVLPECPNTIPDDVAKSTVKPCIPADSMPTGKPSSDDVLAFIDVGEQTTIEPVTTNQFCATLGILSAATVADVAGLIVAPVEMLSEERTTKRLVEDAVPATPAPEASISCMMEHHCSTVGSDQVDAANDHDQNGLELGAEHSFFGLIDAPELRNIGGVQAGPTTVQFSQQPFVHCTIGTVEYPDSIIQARANLEGVSIISSTQCSPLFPGFSINGAEKMGITTDRGSSKHDSTLSVASTPNSVQVLENNRTEGTDKAKLETFGVVNDSVSNNSVSHFFANNTSHRNRELLEVAFGPGSLDQSKKTGVVTPIRNSALSQYLNSEKVVHQNRFSSVENQNVFSSDNSSFISFPSVGNLDTQSLPVLSSPKHLSLNSLVDSSEVLVSKPTCKQTLSLLKDKVVVFSEEIFLVTCEDRTIALNNREVTSFSEEEDRESCPPVLIPGWIKAQKKTIWRLLFTFGR